MGGVFLDNDIGRIPLNDYLYGENGEYDVTTGNHQLGGTRIGYDQNDSVVDKNLKVHSIENLYINGSSVFRTGGHCHPTYTIVKLSLRLADHLKNLKIWNLSLLIILFFFKNYKRIYNSYINM